MGQIMLLPINLGELIPSNHLVRVIDEFVEQMDLRPLQARYKGGGTSSYHPKMMLKVFLFAYTQKIYSSRRIAKALRENIYFMWLSGNQRPDFRTINYFRGKILLGLIEEIFGALLVLLVKQEYIKLEDYFVDGSKLEANANRYTFVWAKNTARYQRQLKEKVKKLFEQIEEVNAAEDARYGDRDLEEMGAEGAMDGEKLREEVAQLNERLKAKEHVDSQKPTNEEQAQPGEQGAVDLEVEKGESQTSPEPEAEKPEPRLSEVLSAKLQEVKQKLAENPDNKFLAKAVKTLEEDYLERAKKYEEQERLLNGRNSYSKTDPDAIFMRMKEDHMRNGQLKPGYNVQIGTEQQFVVGFSLHQEAGDPTCLIPHLEGVKDCLGKLPENIIGDAAYGSEENYAYLEKEQRGNYLKYKDFDKEQKKRYKPNPYKAETMVYDPEQDQFTCPNDKRLNYRWTVHHKTKNNYETEPRVYECESCEGCPLKEKCTKAAGNRKIRVNFQLWNYRQQARENLLSEEGKCLRSQRGIDVETVFGRIKEDWGFRRFLLRGLEKVTVEWGLLCIAHDLAKVWSAQNPKMLTSS